IGAEELLVFTLDVFIFVGVFGIGLLARDVGPVRGVLPIDLEPLLGHRLAVRDDRLDGAFRLAHPAIDAFVGVDDQHVLAFVEAIHRAHFDAIHVLAADAGFSDDVGHDIAFFSTGSSAPDAVIIWYRRGAATGKTTRGPPTMRVAAGASLPPSPASAASYPDAPTEILPAVARYRRASLIHRGPVSKRGKIVLLHFVGQMPLA